MRARDAVSLASGARHAPQAARDSEGTAEPLKYARDRVGCPHELASILPPINGQPEGSQRYLCMACGFVGLE
jgi:hypothetical protein